MASAQYVSHLGEVLKGCETQCLKALEVIGGKAETYAKLLAPVDTGLMRNSITHGVAGGSLSITAYKASTGGGSGSYSQSQVPATMNGSKLFVVIGTNVYYAPYVENGHGKPRKTGEMPFLKPAVEEHGDEYRQILQSFLSE